MDKHKIFTTRAAGLGLSLYVSFSSIPPPGDIRYIFTLFVCWRGVGVCVSTQRKYCKKVLNRKSERINDKSESHLC